MPPTPGKIAVKRWRRRKKPFILLVLIGVTYWLTPRIFDLTDLPENGTFPNPEKDGALLGVVSQLAQQNLQLLVLGRKHMLTPSSRWRKDEMQQVQRQAHCFFADNISEDDPFLLYATLNSGSHCKFITKDLMRDHKACLPDARTQHLFFKWQQGHQLAILKGFKRSKLTLQDPLSYDTVVQTTGDSWHIPYDEDPVQRSSYEVPTKWLCLQGETQAPAPW